MAAGAVIAAAAAAAKRRKDDQAAIVQSLEPWAHLARERKLHFSSATGVPMIEGTILGIACRAFVELDRNGFGHTAIHAVPLETIDGYVGAVPNPGGIMGFLKHHVGQDVETGDAEFDAAFIVTAKPDTFARALLGPALRSYISPLAVRKMGSFLYECGNVSILFPHVEVESEWVGASLDAVVEAARWTRDHAEPFR